MGKITQPYDRMGALQIGRLAGWELSAMADWLWAAWEFITQPYEYGNSAIRSAALISEWGKSMAEFPNI